jgi:predicted LPLAT superfamily acyltransferase
MTNATHWAQTKEVGAAWGIRCLVLIYKLMGRAVLFVVLYPVVAYFFVTNRVARSASRDYLETLSKFAPNAPIRVGPATTFRHFANFARSVGNRIAAWTGQITFDDVTFSGRETLVELIDKGQGALLITAHIGSFEVCRALARARSNIRLNVLVHTAHSEKFNRVMQTVNPNQHVKLIEVTELDPAVAIRLKEKLAAGELIVITGDRIPVASSRITVTPFLGRPAPFPQGPFILAALLKCPVYTLVCLADGNRFHAYLEPLCERVYLGRGTREADLQRYIGQFAARLERFCEIAPLQWFNFFPFWDER